MEQDVEVVRRCFAALSRQDWAGLRALMSEDCEVHDFDIPDVGVYRGPDGVLDWLAQWGSAWESWSPRDVTLREVVDGRVVALFRLVVRGKGSGIDINRHDGVVYTVRGAKVSRIEYYNDQRQALEAVKLHN